MCVHLSSNHLEAFYALSQTLNFTKAAEKLHISQSALSQRIFNLEEELTTTLFIRDRAGLKMTEPAERLLHYCQMKNSLEEEFLQSLRSQNTRELSGQLRVGAFSSVMASVLVPVLASMTKNHPRLKLQVLTREFNELFQLLKRGEIDYMILDGRMEREELEKTNLGSELNYLVQAKSYEGENIYLDHDENDEVTLKYLRQHKMKTKDIQRHFLDDIYGLIEGVKSGLGQAVLPAHLIKKEKSLEIVHPRQSLEIPVYLYYFSRPYYSHLHGRVVEELQKGFFRALAEG